MSDSKKTDKKSEKRSPKWPVIIVGGIALLAWFFSDWIVTQWNAQAGSPQARDERPKAHQPAPVPTVTELMEKRELVKPTAYILNVAEGKEGYGAVMIPGGTKSSILSHTDDSTLVYKHWVNDVEVAEASMGKFNKLPPDIEYAHKLGVSFRAEKTRFQRFYVYFQDRSLPWPDTPEFRQKIWDFARSQGQAAIPIVAKSEMATK